MTIQTQNNPYHGINAHLNSFLQTPGTETRTAKWHSFHASHVAHIADLLNNKLPANYVARSEQSLQIRSETFEFGSSLQRRLPDISIYGSGSPMQPQRGGIAVIEEVDTLELALDETLDLADTFSISAVVIRELVEDEDLGRVVTRIELLSPSNKPGDEGYEAYRKGRNEGLNSLVPLIEIDYLHETPLPFHYRRSRAYTIAVSDPRPSVEAGRAKLYGFNVDAPFPVVQIPLAGSDLLTFDFGAVYQHTFESGRWGMGIDYAVPPPRFGTYSQADQAHIRAVMQRVSVP